MNYAAEIKDRITMREVCETYGIPINRAGFVSCPWHGRDEHPSMKIYDGARGYHCFVCGEGGDVIDFVRKYFGLSFGEAISKINDDFRLGYPIGSKITSEKRTELLKEQRKRQAEKEAKNRKLAELHAERENAEMYLESLERTIEKYKNTPAGSDTEEYYEAIKKIEYAKYRYEVAETEVYKYEHSDNRNS